MPVCRVQKQDNLPLRASGSMIDGIHRAVLSVFTVLSSGGLNEKPGKWYGTLPLEGP